MVQNKDKKITVVTILILVTVLLGINFFSRPQYNFKDLQDYKKSEAMSEKQLQVYKNYLTAIGTDTEASKELFQVILTEEDIKTEVEKALDVKQRIIFPEIKDNIFEIRQTTGKQAVEKYIEEIAIPIVNFEFRAKGYAEGIFSGDIDSAQEIDRLNDLALKDLYNVSVPKEVLPMHKKLISALEGYKKTLQTAIDFQPGFEEGFWPGVYHNYVVINDSFRDFRKSYLDIVHKYQIANLPLQIKYAEQWDDVEPPFVKTAHAFLGIGDITITAGDIPRIIMDAIKEGIRSAFLGFMNEMLNKLIVKIEKNYLIANFLYYSDAVISGQYTEDYLNKYVKDTIDRRIVKKFIPQLTCGKQPENLKPIFKAKASEYLGFDPTSVNPKDQDYFKKMARVGSFMANEEGWEQYFTDLANTTKAEAEKAAEKELLSSGLKTPRDTQKFSIGRSVSGIVSAQRASFTAALQMGISNAEGVIASAVSTLTQALINNHVFKGVAGNSGTLAVLKEQATCVSAAVLNPVIQLDPSVYQNPPPPPTRDEILAQECADTKQLNVNCTDAVLNTLERCSQRNQNQSKVCQDLLASNYVRELTAICSALPVLRPSYCSRVNNILGK